MIKIIKYLIVFGFIINIQFGQYGKNIVQYNKFDWHFIQTIHFDIYYYSQGENHINIVAKYAEDAYDKISNLIGWGLNNRSSIIVYNSHNEFQQTNVVDSYMQEGIGGVTELMKNRMVIPFDGTYKDFKHVIYHELVHVFINDGVYGGSLKQLINSSVVYIPLWMNEGLAEYLAEPWNSNSDMWIRDLAINSSQLPEINSLNGYLAYRGGQSVWKFIAEKWGEESIAEIFYSVQAKRDLNRGFKESIGINIEELSKQWHKYLKKEYWPDIAERNDILDISRQITNHEELFNNYNIAPSISPDGSKIAMYSNKDGEMGIYLISAIDGKFLKKIIRGNRTAEHEELHILKPGISWSPTGEKIIFAAKSGSADALFIYDINKAKKFKKISFETNKQLMIEGITRPAWNPVKNEIAFIGNNGFSSDVYIYDLDTEIVLNLTNDWYSETQVSWHPNGEDLLIISDRGNNLALGNKTNDLDFDSHNVNNFDIYKVKNNGSYYGLDRLTDTFYNESYAIYSPNGEKIAFISDEIGIFNIYLSYDELKTKIPVTNVLTGVTQINWNANNQIIFTGFYSSGFDLFVLSNVDKSISEVNSPPLANWRTKKEVALLRENNSFNTITKKYSNYIFNEDNLNQSENDLDISISALKDSKGRYYSNLYNTRFTLDYAQAYYSFDSYYGAQAMGIFLFSDILGDHRVGIGTELQIDLKASDYFLFYRYLKNKLNHEGAIYHQAYLGQPFISQEYECDQDKNDNLIYDCYVQELNRNFGIDYLTSYPFSRFSRLEGGFNYDYFIRQNIITDDTGDERTAKYRSQNLLKPYVKYVWDNTRWFYTFPVSGSRIYLKYDVAPFSDSNDFSYEMLTFDSRSYIEFSYKSKISFATRIYGGTSRGRSKRKFLIGGTPWAFSSDDDLINREYESSMTTTNEYYFMNNYVFPIRGYEVASKYGQNAILMNYELRLPFLMYYFPTIQYLGQIFGVVFVDMGVVWDDKFPKYNDESSWNLTNNCWGTIQQPDPSDPNLTIDVDVYNYQSDCASGWLMSYGIGPRFILFGMPWKLDYAWQYDPFEGKKSDRKWYITIGFDF